MIQYQAQKIENDVGENEAINAKISVSFVLVVLAIFLFVSMKLFLTQTVKWLAAAVFSTMNQ